MSAWRIWRDCGEWLVSEISHVWANWESFATEEAAVEELRRLQARDVMSAEGDVRVAKERLKHFREVLAAPPNVSKLLKATEQACAAGEKP